MPTILKLALITWRRRSIQGMYAQKSLDAHREEDMQRVLKLRRDEESEIRNLDRDEALIRSDLLIRDAQKLRIPIPSYLDADGNQSLDWDHPGFELRPYALSPTGHEQLLRKIREEKKALHECRARWPAWIGPLSTGINSVIALLTLLTRK